MKRLLTRFSSRSLRESMPALVLAGCLMQPAVNEAASAASDPVRVSRIGNLPLCFEANQAQADGQEQFVARGRGGVFCVRPGEFRVTLGSGKLPAAGKGAHVRPGACSEARPRSVRATFVGANAEARMSGHGELEGKANYFLGNDPRQWQTGIPLFGRVEVDEVYPGVRVIYYGSDRHLEYDFMVMPGADPTVVAVQVGGADRLEVEAEGDLVIWLGEDQIRHHKPVMYQPGVGGRKRISGRYRLLDSQTFGFEVGAYDTNQPLIIDPILSYATYFGGGGGDAAWDLALGPDGSVYVAGETLSAQLPVTPGAVQTNYQGGLPSAGGDAFVARFGNNGSNLLYLTYLGGKGNDSALDIAVDEDGSAYLTGTTDSTNFPVKLAIQPTINGTPEPYFGLYPADAFVTKLNPSGSELIFSTYLGGTAEDDGIGVAVDPARYVYVTGYTESTNFPAVHALQNKLAGQSDAFVAKLVPSGIAFVYCTYLGGTNVDRGEGIAVDAAGRAHVTGYTTSTNFPVTNAFQSFLAGGQDAFFSEFDTNGDALVQSTYLGGLGNDVGFRIGVDSDGNTYVTGSDGGLGFPVTPSAANPGAIFQSLTGGATWSSASRGLPHNRIGSLAIDAVTPARMFAGTWRGVSRSSDGGASWQTVTNAVGLITALTVDPVTPLTVYAAGKGVIKSHDGGNTWTNSSLGLPGADINRLVIDPHAHNTIYAGTDEGVWKSINAAGFWYSAKTGLGSVPVWDLAADPAVTGRVYAATASGVFRSTNGGANWTAFSNGLTNLSARGITIDPTVSSTLFLATSRGVFKSVDAATNWTQMNDGLTSSNVTAIALSPAEPAIVYAGTTFGLFKSADAGLHWIRLTNGLQSFYISAIAPHPVSPAIVYIGTWGADAYGGSDAFLKKFGGEEFSMILGGVFNDEGWDLALGPGGSIYVTGLTVSTDFPTARTSGSLSATNHGANDAFVTAVMPSGSDFLYSTYIGGRQNDSGLGISVDAAGNAYVVGQTSSTNFPTLRAFQPVFGGTNDAFLTKISLEPVLELVRQGDSLQARWRAFASEYLLETTADLGVPDSWTPVAVAPPPTNDWHIVTLGVTDATAFYRLRRY